PVLALYGHEPRPDRADRAHHLEGSRAEPTGAASRPDRADAESAGRAFRAELTAERLGAKGTWHDATWSTPVDHVASRRDVPPRPTRSFEPCGWRSAPTHPRAPSAPTGRARVSPPGCSTWQWTSPSSSS